VLMKILRLKSLCVTKVDRVREDSDARSQIAQCMGSDYGPSRRIRVCCQRLCEHIIQSKVSSNMTIIETMTIDLKLTSRFPGAPEFELIAILLNASRRSLFRNFEIFEIIQVHLYPVADVVTATFEN